MGPFLFGRVQLKTHFRLGTDLAMLIEQNLYQAWLMKSKYESKTAVYQEGEQRSSTECRLFLIEGRVQGVFFRESTRRLAQPLGITGYAKNMADGSVQVLACGDPGALEQLAQWLKHGPPMAQVDRLEWIVSASKCPDSFVTL